MEDELSIGHSGILSIHRHRNQRVVVYGDVQNKPGRLVVQKATDINNITERRKPVTT